MAVHLGSVVNAVKENPVKSRAPAHGRVEVRDADREAGSSRAHLRERAPVVRLAQPVLGHPGDAAARQERAGSQLQLGACSTGYLSRTIAAGCAKSMQNRNNVSTDASDSDFGNNHRAKSKSNGANR